MPSTVPGINRSIHTTLSRGYCYLLLTEETEAESPSHLLAPILTRAVCLQSPVFSPRSTSAERGEMVAPRTLIPGADSGYWSTWVCLCLDKPRQLRRSRTLLVGARGVCSRWSRTGRGGRGGWARPLPSPIPDWPDWAPAPPIRRPPRAAR